MNIIELKSKFFYSIIIKEIKTQSFTRSQEHVLIRSKSITKEKHKQDIIKEKLHQQLPQIHPDKRESRFKQCRRQARHEYDPWGKCRSFSRQIKTHCKKQLPHYIITSPIKVVESKKPCNIGYLLPHAIPDKNIESIGIDIRHVPFAAAISQTSGEIKHCIDLKNEVVISGHL